MLQLRLTQWKAGWIFGRNLAQLKQKVPAGGLMVIGGDFNAEVGNAQAINYPQVFGTTLGTNTSRTGLMFADWCTQENLTVSDSRFPQPLNK